MLKARVLTALVLAPLFVLSVLLLPTSGFAWVIALVGVLAAWEWARLALGDGGVLAWGFSGLFALLFAVACLGFGGVDALQHASVLRALLSVDLAAWGLVLLWLLRPAWRPSSTALAVTLKLGLALVFLFAVCWLLLVLHAGAPGAAWSGLSASWRGPAAVLFLFSVVWVADSGAYFAGKRFGRHKLAPAVSPGKTLEGALGGLALVLCWAVGFAWWLGLAGGALLGFALAAVLAAAFSIVGDLFESLLKRQAGMKDSSQLLPGHGGVLDRIDSVLAAAPVLVASWWLAGLW